MTARLAVALGVAGAVASLVSRLWRVRHRAAHRAGGTASVAISSSPLAPVGVICSPAVTAFEALPHALQQEVYSWCPDAATANALPQSCRSLRWLRSDPAAAALLLLRLPPASDFITALEKHSPARGSGAAAVLQQLLALLGAGPGTGGPHAAPPNLLHAMLVSACVLGDVAAARTLLSATAPPDVDGPAGRPLRAALGIQLLGAAPTARLGFAGEPCLELVELLLQNGAHVGRVGPSLTPPGPSLLPDPRLFVFLLPWWRSSTRLTVLRLLRQHSAPLPAAAVQHAILKGALLYDNASAAAVAFPLSAASAAACAVKAATRDRCAVLRAVLDHHGLPLLGQYLFAAACNGSTSCVALLLDRGADVNSGNSKALHLAVQCRDCWRACPLSYRDRVVPVRQQAVRDMVQLLLQRGATVTPAVRMAAEAHEREAWLRLPDPHRPIDTVLTGLHVLLAGVGLVLIACNVLADVEQARAAKWKRQWIEEQEAKYKRQLREHASKRQGWRPPKQTLSRPM